jgi:hypothetical protein
MFTLITAFHVELCIVPLQSMHNYVYLKYLDTVLARKCLTILK